MTNSPYTDFLAFMPSVIERLNTIKEIKKVFIVDDLPNLTKEIDIDIFDNCVYVILYSYTPSNEVNYGKNQAMEIVFDVILTKQRHNKNINKVGMLLTKIIKSLIGYEPMDEKGQYLTIKPLYLDKGEPILYQKDFAFYPLRFATQTVIMTNH